MLSPADLISMQERVRDIYVDPAVVDYAVRLVTATRLPLNAGLDLKRYISYGASPRASIALVTGARALAFTRVATTRCPPTVGEIALDVLRHRIAFSPANRFFIQGLHYLWWACRLIRASNRNGNAQRRRTRSIGDGCFSPNISDRQLSTSSPPSGNSSRARASSEPRCHNCSTSCSPGGPRSRR